MGITHSHSAESPKPVRNQTLHWHARCIVTLPKAPNPSETRPCIDMRDANKAIRRTRHVIPTIEELVSNMNGATVLSKTDLCCGYLQLVLVRSWDTSQHSQLHRGFYRYNRFFSGLNSAAKCSSTPFRSLQAYLVQEMYPMTLFVLVEIKPNMTELLTAHSTDFIPQDWE